MNQQKAAPPVATHRLFPIDALRGLIIVLMALDHANFFVAQLHSSGEYWGGTFPTYLSALPFLTRFVTHICAPGFFFLMGTGMVMYKNSRNRLGWNRWQFYKHFLIRGLVLILLQFLLVNRIWELAAGGWPIDIYVGVLFALGGAMILGSFLIWLRPRVLIVLSVLLLVITQITIPDPVQWGQFMISDAWSIPKLLLLTPGGSVSFWSNYPILPWLPFMIIGLIFGDLLIERGKQAYRWALVFGATLLTLFIPLRQFSDIGSIRPKMGDTWIDYLNLVKYPPSLMYTLLTLGLLLLLLWLFAQIKEDNQPLFRPLVVFGRSPLFFYLAHLALYAIMGRLLTPNGTDHGLMYFLWLVGLIVLFPLCVRFDTFKRRQSAHSIIRWI